MTDSTIVYDRDLETDTEPATKHDVGEGTAIGAIGGAIVGGLAAGPAGAVIGAVGAAIGAVAGGAASAAAVDAVDKHDHDYVRTEYPGTAVTGDEPLVARDELLVDDEDELVTTPADRRAVI